MIHSFDRDPDAEEGDDFIPDDEEPYCYRCDCKGMILICIDDLCRGAGDCIHGDGWAVCPDCKGASGDW